MAKKAEPVLLLPAAAVKVNVRYRPNAGDGELFVTWPSQRRKPKFDALSVPEWKRLTALLCKLCGSAYK